MNATTKVASSRSLAARPGLGSVRRVGCDIGARDLFGLRTGHAENPMSHPGRPTHTEPTARGRVAGSAPLDELDAIAVRVTHEADPRAALVHPVGRLLGLDALPAELLERAVEVVDGEGDVVVAGA